MSAYLKDFYTLPIDPVRLAVGTALNNDDLKKRAKSGDVNVQMGLALVGELGLDPEITEEDARQYWQQASENGKGWASLNLSKMYEDGRGGDADPEKAAKMLELASVNGYLPPKKRIALVAAENAGGTKPKIVVVDDSKVIRTMLSSALTKAGFQVVTGVDGADGLKIIHANQDLALLLSDIHMPNMDGIEMIRNLRKNKAYDSLPILILSTEKRKEFILAAKQEKVTGWILKPVNGEALLEAVSRCIPLPTVKKSS